MDRSHAGVAKRKSAPPAPSPLRHAVTYPTATPAVATLPRTTLAWRHWLPILGPLMHAFDSAVDAFSHLFALRQGAQAPAVGVTRHRPVRRRGGGAGATGLTRQRSAPPPEAAGRATPLLRRRSGTGSAGV